MIDFLETLFGIIIVFIFAVLGGALIITLGVALSPILLVFALAYLVDTIINFIRVCRGKEEKHIFNITIEEGKDDDDKRGKDI